MISKKREKKHVESPWCAWGPFRCPGDGGDAVPLWWLSTFAERLTTCTDLVEVNKNCQVMSQKFFLSNFFDFQWLKIFNKIFKHFWAKLLVGCWAVGCLPGYNQVACRAWISDNVTHRFAWAEQKTLVLCLGNDPWESLVTAMIKLHCRARGSECGCRVLSWHVIQKTKEKCLQTWVRRVNKQKGLWKRLFSGLQMGITRRRVKEGLSSLRFLFDILAFAPPRGSCGFSRMYTFYISVYIYICVYI